MRVKRPDFFALLTLFVCVGIAVTSLVQAAEPSTTWPGLRLGVGSVGWGGQPPAAPVAGGIAPTATQEGSSLRLPGWASWLGNQQFEFGLLAPNRAEPAWYQRLDAGARYTDYYEMWSVQPVDISYIRIKPQHADFGVTFGIATDTVPAKEQDPEPTVFFSITNNW